MSTPLILKNHFLILLTYLLCFFSYEHTLYLTPPYFSILRSLRRQPPPAALHRASWSQPTAHVLPSVAASPRSREKP